MHSARVHPQAGDGVGGVGGARTEAGRPLPGRHRRWRWARRGDFSDLADWFGPESCDGVLLDLGVSSPQLDWVERGFSFQRSGPLDMRMDTRQPLTAEGLINEASVDEL